MNKRLYDNATTVEDEAAILSDFNQRSIQSYQSLPCNLDLVYSDRSERATLDVFRCDKAQETVIFIHGGYWQYCDKSDFAFIAAPLVQQNIQCILIEYPLAPYAVMSQIVEHIQQALDYLQAQDYLVGKVTLVGHSAGAHLAALHHQHPCIDQLLLMSGIYDLSPIQTTHLNEALNLTATDTLSYSPILHTEVPSIPCQIFYGELELDELKQQSQSYFSHLDALGSQVELIQLNGCNHYNILDQVIASFVAKAAANQSCD